MNFKDRLKQINDTLQPYYLFFTMIFFFITSIGTLKHYYSNSRSDITVSVKYDQMEYPSSINYKYLTVFNTIIESKSLENIREDADNIRKFLTQTQTVKHIRIKNNRDRIISDVAFRDCSVSMLTAYGTGSSFKLSKEGSELLGKMNYDAKSNIVYLEKPITLYPQEEFYITLWGSFGSYNEQNSVFVNYDNRTAKVVSSKEFSGLPAIIADYYEIFFILLLLILFIVLYNSLSRKKND